MSILRTMHNASFQIIDLKYDIVRLAPFWPLTCNPPIEPDKMNCSE